MTKVKLAVAGIVVFVCFLVGWAARGGVSSPAELDTAEIVRVDSSAVHELSRVSHERDSLASVLAEKKGSFANRDMKVLRGTECTGDTAVRWDTILIHESIGDTGRLEKSAVQVSVVGDSVLVRDTTHSHMLDSSFAARPVEREWVSVGVYAGYDGVVYQKLDVSLDHWLPFAAYFDVRHDGLAWSKPSISVALGLKLKI